jgi:CAAX prenyl protease-like protein
LNPDDGQTTPMIREILKMGDARLLRVAQPVEAFDTPELHALIADMFDTMHAAGGVGLAAPQIGVDLQLVIFGFEHTQWLAGILCGFAYQGLVCRKKRLGDALTAHAITNGLLGLWIIWKGAWQFW